MCADSIGRIRWVRPRARTSESANLASISLSFTRPSGSQRAHRERERTEHVLFGGRFATARRVRRRNRRRSRGARSSLETARGANWVACSLVAAQLERCCITLTDTQQVRHRRLVRTESRARRSRKLTLPLNCRALFSCHYVALVQTLHLSNIHYKYFLKKKKKKNYIILFDYCAT